MTGPHFYLAAYAVGVALTGAYVALLYRERMQSRDPDFAPRTELERKAQPYAAPLAMGLWAMAWPLYWAGVLVGVFWLFLEDDRS